MIFNTNADHITPLTRSIYDSPEAEWPRMLPMLEQIDPREKIRTIKMVRFSDQTCGLKEAKDFVESADEESILAVIHAVGTADQLRIHELESQLRIVNQNLTNILSTNRELMRTVDTQRQRIDELHTDYQAEVRGQRNRFEKLMSEISREELENIVRRTIAMELEALP